MKPKDPEIEKIDDEKIRIAIKKLDELSEKYPFSNPPPLSFYEDINETFDRIEAYNRGFEAGREAGVKEGYADGWKVGREEPSLQLAVNVVEKEKERIRKILKDRITERPLYQLLETQNIIIEDLLKLI
jgi:flagellar biosynthesis/type III secretory pathway protein FliH